MPSPLLEGTWEELLMRLGLATLVGLLLGLDRELRGHDAGLRTHALVALSSAMITVSSMLLFDDLREHGATPDPLRVVQGLAQAIGFIAAGLIFVRRGDVKNMTTAANIWMVIGSAIALLLLVGLRMFEKGPEVKKKESE
jgi:putative Mg2+ transporter-C (MgtC) family protein